VNQRNYKTLGMQAHALTRTRYFYSLNVIISHPIVYKEGLGYLSVCAIASRSYPPSHVCICNGHPNSESCCVHCTNIHTYTHTHIYTNFHTFNLAHKHTHTHACKQTYIHTYIHIYAYTYTRTRMHHVLPKSSKRCLQYKLTVHS
jgi:hypothetical protein